MARSLSAALRAAIHAQDSGEVLLALLTITHPQMPGGTVRLVNDLAPLARTVDGLPQLYNPYPFDLTLPDDADDGPQRARLVLDNISREVVEWVRTVDGSPSVRIELVRAAAPDEVEAEFDELEIVQVGYDSLTVDCDLSPGDDTTDPACADTFGPSGFPGLLWAAG